MEQISVERVPSREGNCWVNLRCVLAQAGWLCSRGFPLVCDAAFMHSLGLPVMTFTGDSKNAVCDPVSLMNAV